MVDLRRVTYCGLYCGLCLNGGRIPQRAGELQALLRKVRVEEWGPELPDFAAFWCFLGELIEFESHAGCRSHACGIEPCAIRACAEARKVEACPFCADYPCEHIQTLAKRYPLLLADGERMRDVGLEPWIKEQEARRASGFAYVDIRYDAPTTPPEK